MHTMVLDDFENNVGIYTRAPGWPANPTESAKQRMLEEESTSYLKNTLRFQSKFIGIIK